MNEQLIAKIVDLVEQQDIKVATELNTLDSRANDETDTLKIVEKIESLSEKLQEKLEEFRRSETGSNHIFKWLSAHNKHIAGYYKNYPDRLLIDMLGELANARARHYTEVNPSENWHRFITEMKGAFDSFGEAVNTTDKQIFSMVLQEIDRQFPGLAFPPGTDASEGRRSYIRHALASS